MDTGENKLNAEMMKKLYESYKLHQKEDYEKFVEDCKKIIYMSDRGCSDTEDILKMVKGELITDNHERRIHDPSGKQVLNVFFDEPYPVMMPEDDKMMRGMSNEIRKKFQDYVESETGIPRETITIDSIPENVREKAEHDAILYGDSFVPVYRAPRWVERYLERQRWIDGIKDPEIDILTGATKNFKPQQTYDQLEALCDITDTEAPDRNGRILKREFLKRFSKTRFQLITSRGHKSWLWLNMMDLQKSYEINLMQTLETIQSTKVDLKSVIHMKWPKPEISDMKAHNFRYGKMWQDQALINYAAEDVSHIDTIILDSLATFGSDINSEYGLSTPNLNDIDKKKLERVIKKGKRKK